MYTTELLARLQTFYLALDKVTRQLEKVHSDRLHCQKGCHACCTDHLEVFGIEAAYIQAECNTFLTSQLPHPKGKCAFLDAAGACRIYNHRPFVCRTHGLPLRWIEDDLSVDVEYRDICELNEEGPALETLEKKEVLFTTEWEEYLVKLQFLADKGKGERIQLRELFSFAS